MKARKYRLVEGAKPPLNNQGALVHEALINNPDGIYAEQIAAEIAPVLRTKQAPIRVVAFYLSTWKKLGHIEQLADPSTPVYRPALGTSTATAANVNVADTMGPVGNTRITDEEVAQLYCDVTPVTLRERILKIIAIDELTDRYLLSCSEIHDQLGDNGYECLPGDVGDEIHSLRSAGILGKQSDGSYFLVR